MKFHKILHRLFLLLMFIVCSAAVILLAREKAVAVAASIPADIPTTNVSLKQESASAPYVYDQQAEVARNVPQIPGTIKAVKSVEISTETSDTDGSQIAEKAIPLEQPVADIAIMEAIEPALPVAPIETSPLAEPFIIKAADLPKENNPKFAGVTDLRLSIETVKLIDADSGQKNIVFAGKAQSYSTVRVYVFSSDPLVITLKVDEIGNWEYELKRDLAIGQHEAYVVVNDKDGGIVSKGEPLAFIKTAQSASVIPYSEFVESQSPLEKSSAQYVLIAIIIMVGFLIIALVLIGILTHNRNFNESSI